MKRISLFFLLAGLLLISASSVAFGKTYIGQKAYSLLKLGNNDTATEQVSSIQNVEGRKHESVVQRGKGEGRLQKERKKEKGIFQGNSFLTSKEEEEKAQGLILSFHSWPNKSEKKFILGFLRKRNLKKTESLSFPKNADEYFYHLKSGGKNPQKVEMNRLWFFKWKESGLKPSEQAGKICEELSGKLSKKTLDYCESDNLLKPAQSELKGKRERTKKKEIVSQTEAKGLFECEDCKNKELKPIAEVVEKAVNIRTCKAVSSKYNLQGGKLSDYWAQELIGSDLLREDIKQANISPVREGFIAVFDGSYVNHNIHVKNLISDDGSHAVLPELGSKAVSLFETEFAKDYSKAVSQFYNKMRYRSLGSFKSLSDFHSKYFPAYINNSKGWVKSFGVIYNAFKSISHYSIVVKASGNSFPIVTKVGRESIVISVGSLSPKGIVSDFSQRGEEVNILAPSDNWISSVNNNGSYVKFGGTSGAAPLVTGSLGGFDLLSSYHPSREEAEWLLEKTAIPTIHSRYEKPRKNGAGVLNAYKLGKVASRLKQKCLTQVDFEACMSEEIRKDENYKFDRDKPGLTEELSEIFPKCFGGESAKIRGKKCSDVKRVFKKLREALLLEPKDTELWEVLSCVYKEGGFLVNAEGLKNLGIDTKEEALEVLMEEIEEIGDIEAEEDLERLINIIRIMIDIGESEEGVKFLHKLAGDKDPRVRRYIAFFAVEIGGSKAEGVKLLHKLAGDEDPVVRKYAQKLLDSLFSH